MPVENKEEIYGQGEQAPGDINQPKPSSKEWSIDDFSSLQEIREDISLSNTDELTKEFIRNLDEDSIKFESNLVSTKIAIEEKRMVVYWMDWQAFKANISWGLYNKDPLQNEKKELYQNSLYLKRLESITNAFDAKTTSVEWLKEQWLSASKKAMVDWLKASLSIWVDNAVNTVNKINPIEWARRSNTVKKLETVRKQREKSKDWKAALTLYSTFSTFDRVLWFAQISRILKWAKAPWMKFSQEIHPLTKNVVDQLKKHHKRNRIDWETLNNTIDLVTEMYTKLTWGNTNPDVVSALASV